MQASAAACGGGRTACDDGLPQKCACVQQLVGWAAMHLHVSYTLVQLLLPLSLCKHTCICTRVQMALSAILQHSICLF